MVADTGGSISLSPFAETLMSSLIPPFQQTLDVGLRPTLSDDAETNAPNDVFTEIRLALALQHTMLAR